MSPSRILVVASLFIAVAAMAHPAAPTVRLRGTIEKVDATTLVLKGRGRVVTVAYSPDFAVTEVVPIDPAAIQSGTFVGTTAMPRADGTLSAVEVHVFPEAARGRGEGHRPWDLLPNSTMTNATVTTITSGPNDRTMTLRYKDGERSSSCRTASRS